MSKFLIFFRLAVSKDPSYFLHILSHQKCLILLNQCRAQSVQRNILTFSAENLKKFQRGSENPYYFGHGSINLHMTTFPFVHNKKTIYNTACVFRPLNRNYLYLKTSKSFRYITEMCMEIGDQSAGYTLVLRLVVISCTYCIP